MKGIKKRSYKFLNLYSIIFGVILCLVGLYVEIIMLLSELYGLIFLMIILFLLGGTSILLGVTRNLSTIEAGEYEVTLKYPKLVNGTANQGQKYIISYNSIEQITTQGESILIKTSTGTYMINQLSNAREVYEYINSKLSKKAPEEKNSNNLSEKLEQLYKLYQAGILTKEEYEAKKAEILSQI